MVYSTPKKRVLFARKLTPVLLAVFGVFSLLVINLHAPQTAATASSTVNFQARLQSAAGTIVPDGNYNVEFKLYDASSSSGSSQGSCTGDTHCLWTEDYTGANVVTVKNGYLSVRLGSITAFSGSINWSQQMYLTMNIGGTGTPSWDGEMNPRLALTATPYSFDSNAVGGLTASQLGQLAANQTWTGANTIQDTSTTAFQVENGSSALLFGVDTSGGNVNIGATGTTALDSHVNIGNSSASGNSQFVTIGSVTGSSSTLIQAGASSGLGIQVAATGTIAIATTNNNNVQIGTAATTGYVTIGGTSQTGTITIGQSTASNSIAIGSSVGSSHTQQISIGTSSSGTTQISLGSTTTGSSTAISGGTGGLSLETGSVTSGNSGTVSIMSGDSSSGASGNVNIDTGASASSTGSTLEHDTFESGTDSYAGGYNYTGEAQSSTYAETGSHSLTITSTNQFWGIDSPFPGPSVTPGGLYYMSIWVRGTSAGNVALNAEWVNGSPSQSVVSQITAATTSGWAQLSGYVTAPAGATNVWLSITSNTASADVIYIDNALIEGGSASPYISIGATNAAAVILGSTNAAGGTIIQGGSDGIDIVAATGKSINIGTDQDNAVTVGDNSGVQPLTLQGGGITQTITGSATNPSDIIATSVNSTKAFQVQDSSSANVLTVDTSGDVVDVGSNASLVHPAQLYVKNTNASNRALILQGASSQSVDILDIYNSSGQFVSGYDVNGNEYLNGSLQTGTTSAAGSVALKDGTSNNYGVTLTSQALSNSYSLYLPATGATGSQCLQSTSGSTTSSTTLQFSSCSSISTAPTTTLQNTISPSTSAVVGLTVNGTSGATSAQALIVSQAYGADAMDVNVTGGSQTNGILVNRTNSGTLTNGIQIENTSGTITNGLTFTGTFAADLINAPNLVVTNAGVFTSGSINWSGNITTSGNISTSSTGTVTSAGLLTGNGGLTVSGGAFSLTGNAASTVTTAAGTTSAGVTIGSGNASAGASGSISIDTGTSTSGTPTISIGTANAKAVNIGNSNSPIGITGNTTVTGTLSGNSTVNGATGLQTNGVTRIDASGNFSGGTVNTDTLSSSALTFSGSTGTIGATGTNNSVTVQAAGTGTLSLQASGTGSILIGTTAASTVTIGNSTNGGLFVNNGATENNVKALGNQSGNITLTASTTVDAYTYFTIAQTTASVTVTLPTTGVTAAGIIIYISNTGSTSVTIGAATNVPLANGASAEFIWNGSAWNAVTNLTTSGVTSGTYGSASQVGQFIVNSQGIVTSASNVSISITNSNLQSGAYGAITSANSMTSASSLATVGALNSGSIASGFGSILTTSSIQGGSVTVGASAGNGSFTNNGTTLYATDSSQSFSANGSIANINAYSSITITATATSLTLTLPDPSPTTAGKLLYISNNSSGSNLFTLSPTHGTSMLLNTGAAATLLWNGSAWVGAGSDASSILNQNASTQTANFKITGTGTANALQASSLDVASAGTLTVGGTTATSVTVGNTSSATTIQGGTSSSGAVVIQAGAGGLIGIGDTATTTTINVGGVTNNGTDTVNIATNATNPDTITIGSTNSSSTTKLQAGAVSETLSNTGDVIKTTTNSTSAFQVQNLSSASIFDVDTTNSAIVLGPDGTTSNITIRGGVGTGTNVAGSNITFQASNGTGSGGSGSIILQTAAPTAASSIGVDNSGSTYTFTNTQTLSFTTGSQSNRLMVVVANMSLGNSVSTLAYNGSSLTKITSLNTPNVHGTGGAHIEMWYMKAPSSGTHNLVATLSGANGSIGVTTYYNVDQTTPLGTAATNSGTTSGAGSSSVSTSTANSTQVVVDGIVVDDGNPYIGAPGSGQTQQWLVQDNSGIFSSSSSTKPGTGGTVTTTWSLANTIDWAAIGVPINPVTTGGSTSDTMSNTLTAASNGVQIQNSSGTTLLSVDTINNKTTLTNAGATTSSISTSGTNWDNGGTNVETVSVTPAVVGDIMLVATCECGSGNHVTGISGGDVTTWTQLVATPTTGALTIYHLWEGKITSTGTTNVSISWSGTPGVTTEVNAQEFSSSYGSSANWSFVVANDAHNLSSSTTVTYPSLTSTAAGQAYWGYMVTGATSINNSCTTGTGFTCIQTSTGHEGAAWNTSLAANTAYAPTQTSNASGTSGGVGVIMSALPSSANTALLVSSTGVNALQVQNEAGTSILNDDTTTGALTIAGGLTGGEYNSGLISDPNGLNYTIGTDALVYNLATTSGTTATTATSVFNVTGLPAVDGTVAYFSVTAAKTSSTAVHTVDLEINGGSVISGPATTSTNSAQSVTHSFTLARINGVWAVVGSGLSAAVGSTTSTANTADYAEWIDYSGDVAPQPGDVLTVGDDATSVKDSTMPYDNHAIGVVSTTPYTVGGADDGHSVVMALTGRVPVKVSLENGPIEPGDPLTSSSTPGVAMKATEGGQIIGTALEAYDGTEPSNEINVQLHPGYDNPNPGSIQGNANISGGLYVGGDADIEGSLIVAGTTTTQNLTVSGSASLAVLRVSGGISTDSVTVAGQVSAATMVVSGTASFGGDVTLAGHFITGGTAPTTAVNTATAGSTATCAVAGNDTSGTITLQSQGTGQAAGAQCTLTFDKAFGSAPRTVLSPNDSGSAAMGAYLQSTPTTTTLNFTAIPTAGQTYNYNYFAPQ